MTEARFIENNNAVWKTLEEALRTPVRGFSDIEARMNLYRAVSGHLSYAQAYFAESTLCEYLANLTSDAHAAIYDYTQKRSIRTFLSVTIPGLTRSNASFILVSAMLFLMSVALSFTISVVNPDYAAVFLPVQYRDITMEQTEQDDQPNDAWSPAIMTNSIMVNNIYVSILAFGLGLTCGAGTVYVLIKNGFMLGALAAVFATGGKSLLFWSLILPHGVLELTAICIAGGAGLKIGYSLIRPGIYRRSDALIVAARNALSLMALVVMLLCVAAVIEGFFTPAAIDPVVKLLFSAFTAVPLIFYLWPQKRGIR